MLNLLRFQASTWHSLIDHLHKLPTSIGCIFHLVYEIKTKFNTTYYKEVMETLFYDNGDQI